MMNTEFLQTASEAAPPIYEFAAQPEPHAAAGWRAKLLNWFAATALITSGLNVETAAMAPESHAETITYSDLGYPDASMPCAHPNAQGRYSTTGSCPNYDWGPVHYGAPGWSETTTYSSRGYGYRNCTDYVDWKEQSIGVAGSRLRSLGDGGEWYNNAPASERSRTPKPGDAAVAPGSLNHVAYVNAVNPDGTITVTEYNHNNQGDGDTWTGLPASRGFTEFVDFGIHPASDTLNHTEGSFLRATDTGNIYEIVGGAPIRLYNWGVIPSFHGQAADVTQSQINTLPAYPRNGTFANIEEAGGNGVYEFVGGAPIRQYNWGALPNFNPDDIADINYQSLQLLDHMRAVPQDGSFMSVAEAGGNGIYEFVGGAPIRQYNWGALAAFSPDDTPSVNYRSLVELDHMRPVPADGSIVSIAEAGGNGIYEFIGGAPLRLYNWGIVPEFNGHPPGINYESLQKLDHMHAVPSDGEFVAAAENGAVYRIAGGAPLRLYNQGGIPGFNGAAVPHVNQQTIALYDHLRASPADGTVLEAIDSGTYWQIWGGTRTAAGANDKAIAVDEQTIDNIPLA